MSLIVFQNSPDFLEEIFLSNSPWTIDQENKFRFLAGVIPQLLYMSFEDVA